MAFGSIIVPVFGVVFHDAMSLFLSLLNTAYDYLSPQSSPNQRSRDLLPPAAVSREPSASLKDRLDAACHSPSSTITNYSPSAMRRELDLTKHDLARAHADSSRLEERVKMLEKTLRETRELLRSREAELDKLRKDRLLAERRRSDAGVNRSSNGAGSSSLDSRLTAADLAHRLRTATPRTPSPAARSPAVVSNGVVGIVDRSNAATPVLAGAGEEERARLRSQETFLTRIDSWSGAQILQAVQDLNSEVLQFAASATEMCTFLPPPTSLPNPRLAQAIHDTTARIGPNMTRILSTRDHSQDPLLVQLALQGCVSLCTARALSSFCIGFPSKSDAVLAQIYHRMQQTEPQPTFAKWRALTHHHIHGIYPTLAEYSVNELSDTILRWCADILAIANCHSLSSSSSSSSSRASPTVLHQSPSSSPPMSFSPPKAVLPPPPPPPPLTTTTTTTTTATPAAQLRQLYQDQIKRLSRAVLRLASVTREEIMSTSFEIIIADPSSPFEDHEMLDAFGEYSESSGRTLVTMELGLRCVTRVTETVGNNNNNNSSSSNGGSAVISGGGDGTGLGGGPGKGNNTNNNTNHTNGSSNLKKENGEGKFETRLLLQPKVVLESVLEVLDR